MLFTMPYAIPYPKHHFKIGYPYPLNFLKSNMNTLKWIRRWFWRGNYPIGLILLLWHGLPHRIRRALLHSPILLCSLWHGNQIKVRFGGSPGRTGPSASWRTTLLGYMQYLPFDCTAAALVMMDKPWVWQKKKNCTILVWRFAWFSVQKMIFHNRVVVVKVSVLGKETISLFPLLPTSEIFSDCMHKNELQLFWNNLPSWCVISWTYNL
jgi:hypothetical protein